MQWRVAHQDWFTGFETTRLRKDGTPVSVSISTAPLHAVDGSVTGCVAVYEDITARLQTEEELRRASRMEATATLAAGIAHDFNNLMTGILANAQLLRRDLRLEGEPDEMLEDIGQAALRAGELAQQLLAFARGGKYMPRIINLNDVVVESARLQKGFSPAVRREQALTMDLWAIEADPVQMSQVVMNLALNAVEAIEGSGFVRIATDNRELGATDVAKLGLKPGRYVCLSVEDSGSGMDDATRMRVFEPFFSTKFQGRGLGLAAVYGIVKNHSGEITVESAPGIGTTFRVFLPAAEANVRSKRPEMIG
jgi:signal transduction histidine kinase